MAKKIFAGMLLGLFAALAVYIAIFQVSQYIPQLLWLREIAVEAGLVGIIFIWGSYLMAA